MPDDDFLDNVVNAPVTDDPFSDDIVPMPSGGKELLTDEEKSNVIEIWNAGCKDLKDLIFKVCGNDEKGKPHDGRTEKGRAVKKYLADQNLAARPSHVYVKKTDSVILTEENKEFITNNAGDMKPMEIAKLLFKPDIQPLSAEFRVVKEFYDSLDNSKKALSEDENVKKYSPPRTPEQAIARINKYVLEGIDPKKMTVKHHECVAKLIKFMHTFTFLLQMNNLPKNSERELFESTFVRMCHDKPDLTEEEIELYLNYCSDRIASERMKRDHTRYSDFCEVSMESEGKVQMALVEVVNKLSSDIDDIGKKMEKTLQSLNGKRSERIKSMQANNESVLRLVDALREESDRRRWLRVIEMRAKMVEEEAGRLETLDDLKFQLWGGSKDELIT